MKRLMTLAVVLMTAFPAGAVTDTLRLSTAYTTHIIFATDLTYADLSNSRIVAAKIIEQNKNMLAVKAKCPFTETTSISALESNGMMHTWIVTYDDSPEQLIIDTRVRTESQMHESTAGKAPKEREVSRTGRADAPLLSEIIDMKQGLYHLGETQYGISVQCENIFAYSDITYIVLSLKNSSGVSYDIPDATFVIESKKKGKRTVVFDKTLFPRSRYGALSAGPKEVARMAYSFDKMTLSKDQVLKVYFYESSGQRNLSLTIDTNDVNKARPAVR